MQALRISLYLLAFVFSNFIVLWFGNIGLIFTALFLIPFDFVIRCFFHESWKGFELIWKLGLLVLTASVITYILNRDTLNIAYASCFGYISAQLVAGIFYQIFINKSYFIKVNGSDAVGILIDSIIFQLVAFSFISVEITISQFLLKLTGGFFWYWVFFVKYKLQDKL